MARPASVIESLNPATGDATTQRAAESLKSALAMMQEQQAALARDAAQGALPAELYSSAKYVFRTRPGAEIRRLLHTVDVRPEDMEDSRSAHLIKRWEKRHPTKAERELLEHVADVMGRTFAFQQVRGRKECFLETNDDRVAAYLRGFMERGVGDFVHVYEERGTKRIKVGDQVFPATALGRTTAMAYADKMGITQIDLIDEES